MKLRFPWSRQSESPRIGPGAVGVTGVVLGTVGLIVPDADPGWMFSPHALLAGFLFLLWDLWAHAPDTDHQVSTGVPAGGRSRHILLRVWPWLLVGAMMAGSSYSLITYYADEAARMRSRDQGAIVEGTVEQLVSRASGRSYTYEVVYSYPTPSGMIARSTAQVPRKRYYTLAQGRSIRVALTGAQGAHGVLADIEMERALPAEIAWMLLLLFPAYPGWCHLRSWLRRILVGPGYPGRR